MNKRRAISALSLIHFTIGWPNMAHGSLKSFPW
jgi:hypothetical protein